MRRVGLVAMLLVLWVVVGVPRLVGAAQATPTGSPATSGCDVEPVSIDGATPAASDDEVTLPEDGPTADPDTIADLQATLDDLLACVATGDIERVAALFTPAGFAREVLAEEPVQIEPGTPNATPVADGDVPLAPPVDPGVIDRAFVLEDGSVAAYVDVETRTPRLIIFVEGVDGRWLIDAIEPIPSEATPEVAVGPEEVPAEVWDAVVVTLGLTGDATITVLELEAVDWPDASLGCPEEGGFYAQVITPGYRVVVEVDGQRTEIHTDLQGTR